MSRYNVIQDDGKITSLNQRCSPKDQFKHRVFPPVQEIINKNSGERLVFILTNTVTNGLRNISNDSLIANFNL